MGVDGDCEFMSNREATRRPPAGGAGGAGGAGVVGLVSSGPTGVGGLEDSEHRVGPSKSLGGLKDLGPVSGAVALSTRLEDGNVCVFTVVIILLAPAIFIVHF